MKKSLIRSAVVVATTGVLVACGTTQPTPQEQAQIAAVQNAFISAMSGTLANQQLQNNQPQQKKVEEVVQLTETELLDKKAEIVSTGSKANFKRKKDGILIDGKIQLDPEGEVITIGANRLTGEYTYLIKTFDGNFKLKFSRANSQSSPITIANVYKNGKMYNVKTVTGKSLTGNAVIPTSDGVVVSRSGSAFQYIIGENLRSISAIDNYRIAPLQKGDIASTNLILLEKIESSRNMMDELSSLGRTFGLAETHDYVLANISTGELIPMDVNLDGKKDAKYSNCYKRNNYVNECGNVEMVETLFDLETGMRNSSHYFWAIDWINSQNGPLAIYSTGTKLKAIDINNKEMHTVFQRMMGINKFDIDYSQNSEISIRAQLGFSFDTVDDLESYIDNDESELIEPMTQLDN